MFRAWVRLCLVAAFLANQLVPTLARAADADPTPILRDIEDAGHRMRQGDMNVGEALDRDIAALAAYLGQKDIPFENTIILRYYTGIAYYLRNEFNNTTKKAYDLALARKALEAFEAVAASITGNGLAGEQNSWANIKANALFFAGNVAYAQLKDPSKAYRYWTSCASMDHAGCLNTMAVALTTGDGELKQDLTEALRMHKRVFETATRYGCAGVFSAYSAALLVGLGGVKNTKDNAEIWIENASNLLNAVQMNQPEEDLCGRSDIQLASYLIGWSHGKKDPTLLDAVLKGKGPKGLVQTAHYLKGDLDQTNFETSIAPSPDALKCGGYFYALWAADIQNDGAHAKHFMSLLAPLQDISCRIDAAYARSAKSLQ